MGISYYDPELDKTYECENEYEFKIKSFSDRVQSNFFENEVIEYALSLKDELINELDNDSSKSDKIRCEHIKWIEKHLDGIHDFLIQQKINVPKILENDKTFIYSKGKKTGRPRGSTKRTIDRYKKVFKQYTILKKKYSSYKKAELYELLASRDYDSKTFSRRTIRNIIEDKKYNLKPRK